MLDSLCKIEDVSVFVEEIKKEAVNSFLLSYKNSKNFINKFNSSLLSNSDVMYEIKNYIVIKNSEYYIDGDQKELLIYDVYKQLVYKIMSKLVDEGILELCWDSTVMNFFWRKKKYARVNKWKV